jgi:hypothetical protein
MNRHIAILASGCVLGACSSWMPSFDLPSMPGFSSAPPTVVLSIETDPPGADAKISSGGACRTPCSLEVAAAGPFSVNLSLNGYQSQSVAVQAIAPETTRSEDGSYAAPSPRLEPNPIYVELQAAPAPKPAPRKPRAAKPAPQAAATRPPPPTTTQFSPPPPAAPATAPWPTR